jgi:hypothetical protein
MLIKKCFRADLFPNLKFLRSSNKNFTSMEFEENLDDKFKFKDDKDRNRMEDWKKKTQEESENVMRRAHEIVRNRQEEAKRSNKEFLMKMKIPGVKENPER